MRDFRPRTAQRTPATQRAWAALAIVASACAPAPTPYLGPAAPTPTPSLSAAAVGGVVDGVAPALLQSPKGLFDLYRALVADGVTCADEFEHEASDDGSLVDSWVTDGCDEDGTAFAGAATVTIEIGVAREEDGAVEDTFSLEGDRFSIVAADGRFLDVAGALFVSRAAYDGGSDGSVFVSGSFTADDAEDPPLPSLFAGGLRGDVEGYASADDDGSRALDLRANVAGPALAPGTAVDLDVRVAADPCGNEPEGVASVRDDAGVWHDVVFDADDAADRCDGCGDRGLAGAPADDRVCVDTSGLLTSWEGSPW